MRGLKTWAWTVVIAALAASPAFAQTTGTTGTGGIASGSSYGGSSSLGSSSLGSSSLGSSSLGSSTIGGGSSSLGGGMGGTGGGGGNFISQAAPTISATTGTTSSSVQKSNFLSGYFANPYYQGIAANNPPGGFGSPLYGTTTTSGTGGRGGAAGGLGGRGSQSSTANQSGIMIPLPVQISYTAEMRFATPPVAAPKLQADLRGIIDAGGLTNSKTVQVLADGTNITLRGTVKDDEEARLVEGLVRLTPGVGNITNELTYPLVGSK